MPYLRGSRVDLSVSEISDSCIHFCNASGWQLDPGRCGIFPVAHQGVPWADWEHALFVDNANGMIAGDEIRRIRSGYQ